MRRGIFLISLQSPLSWNSREFPSFWQHAQISVILRVCPRNPWGIFRRYWQSCWSWYSKISFSANQWEIPLEVPYWICTSSSSYQHLHFRRGFSEGCKVCSGRYLVHRIPTGFGMSQFLESEYYLFQVRCLVHFPDLMSLDRDLHLSEQS